MAGGLVRYRHLSRTSSQRKALLRSQVTALVMHEHIQTTYAKAKESQRLAEKLITLAKKNTFTSRKKVQAMLYEPHTLMNRVFNDLRTRYQHRDGGYTRVTRTDTVNTYDQAEYAILEFVDGPRDSRFMMTAMAVARDRVLGHESNELTLRNAGKVTRYRGGGGGGAATPAANEDAKEEEGGEQRKEADAADNAREELQTADAKEVDQAEAQETALAAADGEAVQGSPGKEEFETMVERLIAKFGKDLGKRGVPLHVAARESKRW